MTYKPYDPTEIAKSWWSGERHDVIAAKLGMTTRELYNRWKTLKKNGLLPKGRNRRTLQAPDIPETVAHDLYDGRPTTLFHNHEDELLERLRRYHQHMV
jgi:hypothetical protein